MRSTSIYTVAIRVKFSPRNKYLPYVRNEITINQVSDSNLSTQEQELCNY